MFKFFNISCEQANEICNKAQYGEATFTEKLKLNWHLLICKFCRLYTKQNQTLTKVCNSKAEECKSKETTLDSKDKETLKEQLKKMGL